MADHKWQYEEMRALTQEQLEEEEEQIDYQKQLLEDIEKFAQEDELEPMESGWKLEVFPCTCVGAISWCGLLCEDKDEFSTYIGCDRSKSFSRLFELKTFLAGLYFKQVDDQFLPTRPLRLKSKNLEAEMLGFFKKLKLLSAALGNKSRIRYQPLEQQFRAMHEALRVAVYHLKEHYVRG